MRFALYWGGKSFGDRCHHCEGGKSSKNGRFQFFGSAFVVISF